MTSKPTSRRAFLATSAHALTLPFIIGNAGSLFAASAANSDSRAKIAGFSACSWTLRDGSPGVFKTAQTIGLDGVEVDFGSPKAFAIDTAEKRKLYKDAASETGMKVATLALGCLNGHPLKSEPKAPGWVLQAIEAAADFQAKVVLLAFFGKGELKTSAEMRRVGDILKEIAPVAEKKGVILGLENTLSAKDSLKIIEQAGSSAVRVYYDVSNSRYWGHDGPREIRELKDLICGVHFKDGVASYRDARLGEGKVDYPAIAASIHAIGYRGWITLECMAPKFIEDMKFSLAFAKKTLGVS